jgi:hypothetical protein
MITGQCLCGAVKFTADAPPRDVHHCHCGMCRRATGAAFATLAWFPVDEIVWTEGEPARHRSSSIAARGFCAQCGTSLFLQYDGNDQIAIMIGALDEAEELRPSHHYGIESRLPWADIQSDLPGRATDSDPQPD